MRGSDVRSPDYPVPHYLLDRWSPRAMSGRALSETELFACLEGGRWAPSAGNLQPWRFLYSLRDSESWATWQDLLVVANREWAHQAGALAMVLSTRKLADGKPHPWHAFDAGAAWMGVALAAADQGIIAHAIAGFDAERARKTLHVHDELEIDAIIVLGRPGDPAKLPERLKDRERPSDRKPLSELVFEGSWPRLKAPHA